MSYVVIEVGDKFLCKKNFKMDDKTIEYRKGEIYLSEQSNCLTDESGDTRHFMGGTSANLSFKQFSEYFKQV